MIAYLHHHPLGKKIESKYFHTPMKPDHSGCGYYSDRIYNMHGESKRFYIATFGYEKAWKEHNTYEREIDRYIIHFVFDGQCIFNGCHISAGQYFVAPQTEKHTIIQDEKQPMTFGWIAFSGTELENQLSLLHLTDLPKTGNFQNKDKIQEIFMDTVYGPYSDLDLELFMFSAFYKIMAHSRIINPPTQPVDNIQTNQYFSEIMTFINTHYSENIGVADVAKHVHLSTPYLRRICIQKSGKSPQDLITQKRLNVAKSMLANSHVPIGDIALFVGFSGQTAFSKFFSRNCGMSAQSYRQQQIETRQKNSETIARTENNWRVEEARRIKNIEKLYDET